MTSNQIVMKKLVLFLIVASFCYSCNKPLKESGSVEVLNGNDIKTQIPYQIGDFNEFQKTVSKIDFDKIVEKSSIEAKNNCKYILTFEPMSISMFSLNDTITTIFRYSAKNAFGVPDELTTYCKFKGAEFIRSF